MSKTNSSKKEIFTNWIKDYTDVLLNFASQKISCKETAEDLVQDTFLAAYKNFDSFKRESSPKTWLYAILKNKILEYYRSAIKKPLLSNIDKKIYSTNFSDRGDWLENQLFKNNKMNDENLLDNAKFIKTLENCLNNLPKPWRLAVQLKYLSSKNSSEICKELNISTSNYWQIIHRAKLKLKNCIDINWFNKI